MRGSAVDSLARFTIEHIRFSALLVVAIGAAGAAVFLTQPRQEDPEITLRSAQVVTQAPGLAPERIEHGRRHISAPRGDPW